jgi:hypothetical protein
MADHQMRPADLAKRMGLPTPNAIYNLLGGRSSSLSQPNLERLLAIFPGQDVLRLLVDSEATEVQSPDQIERASHDTSRRAVLATMTVHANYWSPDVELPEAGQFYVPYPAGFVPVEKDLFAVLVNDPGDDATYPVGSILLCFPFEGSSEPLPYGARLVVVTRRDDGFEVSVRSAPSDGEPNWLLNAMHYRSWVSPIGHVAQWPCPPNAGSTISRIAGIVTAAWMPDWNTWQT